eukprot:TRINITY_DN7144_c0_g1_i4.p1 TRINITY_DN7144_c0_g1~~TRINITY_DN7144_c0_g1_i4.p1  ORF type:complete len:696 (+),score=68.79 TRINITY_DN7144_c0_g1_i4:64-2088(+)
MVGEVIGTIDNDVRAGMAGQFAPKGTWTPKMQLASAMIEDTCSLVDLPKKYLGNVNLSSALSSSKGQSSVVGVSVANAGQLPNEGCLSPLAYSAELPSLKDLQSNPSRVAADVNLFDRLDHVSSQVDSIQTHVGDIKAMLSLLFTKLAEDKSDESNAVSSLNKTLRDGEALMRDIVTEMKENGECGMNQESMQVSTSDSDPELASAPISHPRFSHRSRADQVAESPFVGLVQAATGVHTSHAAHSKLLRKQSSVNTEEAPQQTEKTTTKIELVSLSIFCLDMVWMVISLHFENQAAVSNTPREEAVSYRFRWIDGCFIVLYSVEIVVRLLSEGSKGRLFFKSWSCVFLFGDVANVTIKVAQLLFADFKGPLLKVFRFVHILYVTLTLHRGRFGPAWLLTMSTISSSIVILQMGLVAVIVIFLTAVALMGGISEMLHHHDLDEQFRAALHDNFGSLGITMMTLFKCISGGIDWSVVLDLLEPASMFYRIVFTIFVIIMVYGVSQILTALIIIRIEGILIVHTRRKNQALMIRKDSSLHLLRAALLEQSARSQPDRSADISRMNKQVVYAVLHLPEVHSYLRHLGVTSDVLAGVVDLLDVDDSCEVCIDEFLNFLIVFASSPDRVGQALSLFHHKQAFSRLHACSRQLEDITHEVLKELQKPKGNRGRSRCSAAIR